MDGEVTWRLHPGQFDPFNSLPSSKNLMLSLRTLGGLAVEGGTQSLGPVAGQPKRLALLALVGCTPSGLSRDKALAFLWPESDTAHARNALNQALHSLRRDLGTPDIIEGTTELRLNLALIQVDTIEFDTAFDQGNFERAVALYKGPFLDGFFLVDAPAFEEWVARERDRLARRYRQLLERLANEAQANGRPADALRWYHSLVAADPLSSRSVLELMKALAATDEAEMALRIARNHEVLLHRELGVGPDASVRLLAEQIRDSRPLRARPSPEAIPSLSQASQPLQTGTGRPGSAKRGLLLQALVVASVVILTMVVAWRATRPELDQRRVLVLPFVTSGDSTLASVSTMAQDWVINGLVKSVGLDVVVPDGADSGRQEALTMARRLNAGTVVDGRVSKQGDSLFLAASIIDVGRRKIVHTVDIRERAVHPEPLVESLRQKLFAALAVRVDTSLFRLSDSASQPTSFEAYQTYRQGRRVMRQFGEEWSGIQQLLKAAELDTTWVVPLIWAAYGYVEFGMFAAADSIIDSLETRRLQLAPLDLAVLDMVHSRIKGLRGETYLAAKKIEAMEPGSEWLIDLASAATFANRPREGLDATRAIPPGDPLRTTPDWSGWKFWRLVGGAHHMLGDYQSQLRIVDEGRAVFGDPEKALVEVHLSALAGLGRTEEALRVADSASAAPERPNGFPIFLSLETGAQELEAHGYSQSAREMRLRAEALNERRLKESPDRRGILALEAYRAYNRGDWAVARSFYDSIISIHDSISRASGTDVPLRERLRFEGRRGFMAARMGDRARAEQVSQWMATLSERFLYGQNTIWRARIAAALGDKKEAVDLIRQALGEGEAYGWHLHRDRELVLLRGYPPFEELLRPIN